MTLMRSATATPRRPRFHVAIIGALGIGDREQKPFASVEKSQPPDIGAEEGPKPVGNAAGKRHFAARGRKHRRARGRIAIHARDRVLDLRHRKMIEWMGQTAALSIAD